MKLSMDRRGTDSQAADLDEPLLNVEEEGCLNLPTRAGSSIGILWLRACDGFSRNIIFANQIDLLKRYGGFGSRGAQQAAHLYGATCSGLPLLIGWAVEKLGFTQHRTVLGGCFLEAFGMLLLATITWSSPRGAVVSPWVGLCFCSAYAVGFAAVSSTLPVLARQSVTPQRRAAMMQNFYAALTTGSMLGILATGLAQVYDAYGLSFVIALFVFGLGATSLMGCKGSPVALAAAVESDAPPVLANPTPCTWSLVWPLFAMWPFYLANSQWGTSWYVQSEYTHRRIAGVLTVPLDMMQVVERISSITFLVLIRRYWMPADAARKPPSPLLRMALASAVAALALGVSAAVEVARRERWFGEISILWLVPQFVLIAAAEALAYPAQADWSSGSSTLTGLSCASSAAASATLGAFLGLPWLRKWVPEESPDEGHYEFYYAVLASLCLLVVVPLSVAGARTSHSDSD